jgi:8-oxo-dGTP pyrophosphatase MutT (NUDIX family)
MKSRKSSAPRHGFELERAAARYFGVLTHAAHVNGLVRRSDRAVAMWIARRSDTKAIDPGMLDNLVGGGIATGHTVASTVIKEAFEEAGIEASVASHAIGVGKVTSAGSSLMACSAKRSSFTTSGCRRTSCPSATTAKSSSTHSFRWMTRPR